MNANFNLEDQQQHHLSLKGYFVVKSLIKGSSGSVYKVRKQDTFYALKHMKVTTLDRSRAEREVRILRRLQHEFIVQFVEAFEHDSQLSVILEFAEKGDLISLIGNTRGPFKLDQCRVWFQQLLYALIHLRLLGIAHRDIKTDNVLVFENRLKITDFGHAIECSGLNGEVILVDDSCGTIEYNSPESIFVLTPYDAFLSDVFMLGVLLNVIVTCHFPFHSEKSCRKHFYDIIEKNRLISPRIQRDSDLAHLLDSLLEPEPDNRITLLQALNHPWTNKRETTTTLNN